MDLATTNALEKDEFISCLCTAISLLEGQLDHVSSLEFKVGNFGESLEEQDIQVERLESEAIQMKVFFAETVLNMQRSIASPCSNPPAPSYASAVRGNVSISVLVVKCVDVAPSDNLDLLTVKMLLDTPYKGLIPSHVRYKNNKVYGSLENDFDVAKAADILNNKPDFQFRFDSASRLSVLFLVVGLFVNVSDTEALKKELGHRNKCLRGRIHSAKVVFTKPHTTEGHVTLFLRIRQAKEEFSFLGKPRS
jgi:hypothetical protein